jgi:hypothetical protein
LPASKSAALKNSNTEDQGGLRGNNTKGENESLLSIFLTGKGQLLRYDVMSVFSLYFTATQAIAVDRTDPDMPGNQADQIFKSPHRLRLLPVILSL